MFRKHKFFGEKFGSLKFIRTYKEGLISQVEVKFNNGRDMSLSSGLYARFANGTAVCQMEETAVIATAVSSKQKIISGFAPITVDYRLKSSATGRIPSNFFRRDSGTSESEILSARIIDRSIRPLFSKAYNLETQIICNVLASNNKFSPDVLGINAASAALAISDIPWNGPIGAVRVGLYENDLVINPNKTEMQSSLLDLVIAATKSNFVVMIEGKGEFISINTMARAIKFGTQQAQLIISAIENLQKKVGKEKYKIKNNGEVDETIYEAVQAMTEMRLREIFSDYKHDKMSRDFAVNQVKDDIISKICPSIDAATIGTVFSKICRETFRNIIFEGKRCDGRYADELRKISCQINLYKPLHGSALFQRGQTQVFCTVSLDSLQSALKLDPLSYTNSKTRFKNFILHYEFPPFATGETGRIGSIGRREIGHGALAEKALIPVLPDSFPFTIRLTSEVLESNGSSSMATICAGSLALMDAGVPLSTAVAGVAIGLVTRAQNNENDDLEYRILCDILGIEDYMGDMDMKIAGTENGFTALQLDLKIPGIPLKIIFESLDIGFEANQKILNIMNKCIHEHRNTRKESWPVSEKLTFESQLKSVLFGNGGINLKKVQEETDVQFLNIEENNCMLFAPSKIALKEAKELIEKILEDHNTEFLEFGGIYTAKIVEVKDTGVMVTLYQKMNPVLIHNSQLDQKKVIHASALNLKVGEEFKVKFFGRDPVTGFMRLSRKVLQAPTTSIVKNLDKKN